MKDVCVERRGLRRMCVNCLLLLLVIIVVMRLLVRREEEFVFFEIRFIYFLLGLLFWDFFSESSIRKEKF